MQLDGRPHIYKVNLHPRSASHSPNLLQRLYHSSLSHRFPNLCSSRLMNLTTLVSINHLRHSNRKGHTGRLHTLLQPKTPMAMTFQRAL